MLKYSCFFLADMDGTLDESFLSVVSEDAPMVPHWEIGTINMTRTWLLYHRIKTPRTKTQTTTRFINVRCVTMEPRKDFPYLGT